VNFLNRRLSINQTQDLEHNNIRANAKKNGNHQLKHTGIEITLELSATSLTSTHP
jgi:hypothetical protein